MMRTAWTCMALAAVAACNGEDYPTGFQATPEIHFHLVAPATLPTKAVVEIETVITAARFVRYPLTVVYEKANAGEPFFEVGTLAIQGPDGLRAAMGVPILMDPRIRVTVSDGTGYAESRIIEIDVLDFE